MLESIEGEKTKTVATAVREDSVRAVEALMGDNTRDDGQHCFKELGGVLLPRSLDFQGPDIDPYLPWVREVDVATMMAELSHEIEVSATKVPPPSWH